MTVAEFVGSCAAPIARFIMYLAVFLLGFSLLSEINNK
jgi:hypothetical protein